MKKFVLPVLFAAGLSGCQFIPGTEANAIAQAKAAVSEKLKDPTSALFSDIKVVSGGVCGQVNGKNSYGAYEGNTGFVWKLGTVYIEDPAAGEDVSASLEQCQYRALAKACLAGKTMLALAEESACTDAALEAVRKTYS